MPISLSEDPEWKFIQTFINRVLREGMEREAEKMQASMKASRRYRYKVMKRLMREQVYSDLRGTKKNG